MKRTSTAAAVALLVLLGGCGGDGEPRTTSASTTTTSAASSSTVSEPAGGTTSTAPPRNPEAEDWDGVRFDYGILDRIDRTEDGRTLLRFDRGQLPGGLRNEQAAELTEEPIVVGNTDLGMVNDSRRLRTYVAAPGLEVLRIGNLRRTCADLEDAEEPRCERISVDDVIEDDLASDLEQVSLTFDDRGLVTRIRLSDSC